MISRDEYRQLMLAGTVTFPATFPQVGRLELHEEQLPDHDAGSTIEVLHVCEMPNARVTLTRKVLAHAVRAIFIPRDLHQVNYGDGKWYLGREVITEFKHWLRRSECTVHGIVFVAENEPSILSVSAGMTAAESAQYYPPLPNDLSNNHYNTWPRRGAPASCYGSCYCQPPEDESCLSVDQSVDFAAQASNDEQNPLASCRTTEPIVQDADDFEGDGPLLRALSC